MSALPVRPSLPLQLPREFPMRASLPVQVGVPHLSVISGGGLSNSYKAVQFHLHWGNNGGPGSEHTIDGEQYPMEVPQRQGPSAGRSSPSHTGIVRPNKRVSSLLAFIRSYTLFT